MGSQQNVLVASTVASTIDQFCMNDIDTLSGMDCSIDIMANFDMGNNTSRLRVDQFKKTLIDQKFNVFNICFSRNPLTIKNIKTYFQVKRLLYEKKYDLIHCHTPIAAMIVRFAARKFRKNETKVVYTAHGFHFYQGAPLLNWLVYYPIEKWLARYTDLTVTINREDYEFAKRKITKNVIYMPGIGIDLALINANKMTKQEMRDKENIGYDTTVLLSVGELNKNKNHEVIIRALAQIKNDNILYIICGKGKLDQYLTKLAQSLNVEDKVRLLGFRSDVYDIYKLADVYVFPSYREGLSLSLMEAMASKLPVICSSIRGNTDLISNEKGGYTVRPNQVGEFAKSISALVDNKSEMHKMGEYNSERIKANELSRVKEIMKNVYTDLLGRTVNE